jgi:aspartate-semialdehyde dehydrogenase
MSQFGWGGCHDNVVGIAGATGAVGIEVIACLHKRKFPVERLRLFASSKSAGKTVKTSYGDIDIEEFSVASACECKFLFLCVSGDFSLEFVPQLLAYNAHNNLYIIDNSSAYRYDSNVPLVVPEINGYLLDKNDASSAERRIIANPNCTTAIAAVVLWPIHQKYKIKKLIVSTYQAASGAGAEVRFALFLKSTFILLNSLKYGIHRVWMS